MGLINEMIKTRRGDRLSRDRITAVQRTRLEALVRIAKEKSPFYRKLYAGIGDGFSLTDLPVVSKPEMMAHFDEFYLTYPSVTEGTPMYIAPEDRVLIW